VRASQVARDAIRDEMAIRHLEWFVRAAWPVVEPGRPLVWNWHLSLLCDALERQMAGEPEYRKLLICVPPGTMKSLLVSVFAPAWEWLWNPSRRKLFLANDEGLTIRDSRRTRDIITSEWYQGVLARVEAHHGGTRWELARDQSEKRNFENTERGFRQCLSIGAKVTGKRADDIVIDDPIDAKDVVRGSVEQVTKRLQEVGHVVGAVLPSRVNDLTHARWTVIMQRLHPDDTAGKAIEEGGWHVVQLQMEYDPDNPLNHPEDPRTEHGEPLFPSLFPPEALEDLRHPLKLGARHYAAQYQQTPTLPEGGMFRREWMRYYTKDPGSIHVDGQMISVDCTFKRTSDSDFVVMQAWGWRGSDRYLLGQKRARMTYTETKAALVMFCARFPRASAKIIEDKANGSALIDDLQGTIQGLIPYNPRDSKEARAQVAATYFEAGNVHLPSPEREPWVLDYVEELCAFPGGSHDDQVDATSQAMIRMESHAGWSLEVLAG
jgi:predicted phage terminase large subunit-like protein